MQSRPLTLDEKTHFFMWAKEAPAAPVIEALNEVMPECARFVGGCVRDSLLGQVPKDIDIATQLTPGDVVAALKRAGVKAVPTGIAHGTVTAIVNHQVVEITSLRSDISTDGRRAIVAFTTQWEADALRRDFTINAIYLDADGNLYDYGTGLEDLDKGQVRFIGDSAQRISEDYLRILRFFRFSARFVTGDYDAAGMEACESLKVGIATLSKERIGDEFEKILCTQNAVGALNAMVQSGVLTEIWPEAANLEAFARLKKNAGGIQFPLALACLWYDADAEISRALRLSNVDEKRRKNAVLNSTILNGLVEEVDFRRWAYKVGKGSLADALVLYSAIDQTPNNHKKKLLSKIEDWPLPKFPLRGADVLQRGLPEGVMISSVLTKVEDRWIGENFPPSDRLNIIFDEEIQYALGYL